MHEYLLRTLCATSLNHVGEKGWATTSIEKLIVLLNAVMAKSASAVASVTTMDALDSALKHANTQQKRLREELRLLGPLLLTFRYLLRPSPSEEALVLKDSLNPTGLLDASDELFGLIRNQLQNPVRFVEERASGRKIDSLESVRIWYALAFNVAQPEGG